MKEKTLVRDMTVEDLKEIIREIFNELVQPQSVLPDDCRYEYPIVAYYGITEAIPVKYEYSTQATVESEKDEVCQIRNKK